MRLRLVWVLLSLQFLLGLGAAVSGALLIFGPDGRFLHMPLYLLRTTPFVDFLLPGMFLFTFVEIYPLAVASSLFAQPS